MKKKISLIFGLGLMLLLLAACGNKMPTYHTVSFNSNGAEEYQGRAIEDNHLIIEPQVPTRVGYTFLGWYKGDTKWNFETDKVTESFTLSAKWKRVTFNVKFDSNGGSAVEEQVIESGNYAVEPTAPTKKDSRFIGWYNGDEKWYFNLNRVTDYITLVAKWEDFPTYTVEFDSAGGSSVPDQYVIEGYKVTEPAPPTKKDCKFIGWYDGDVLWNFNANTINSNKKLTAKWEVTTTFTVTFNSNGGSPVEAQHVTIGGKAIKPPTPDRTQLSKFIGWYLGNTEWNFDTPITENITLVARWQNIYTVTFDTEGLIHYPSVTVDEGDLIPKQNEPSKKDHRFIGWYFGEKKWDFDTDKPTSDMTLVAKWESNPTYTVTFDSQGGSQVSTQYVLENHHVTAPANPTKSGFRFDGWYVQDKPWDFNTGKVTSNINLTAKWVEVVMVLFSSDGGSIVNPSYIDKNTAASAPQEPKKEGFVFRGWMLPDGTLWDFNTPVTQSIELKAKWLVACKVTFDTDGIGNIPSITLGKGEFVPKPSRMILGEKYEILAWYIAGTETEWNFNEMPVTEDVVLVAEYIIVLPFAPAN